MLRVIRSLSLVLALTSADRTSQLAVDVQKHDHELSGHALLQEEQEQAAEEKSFVKGAMETEGKLQLLDQVRDKCRNRDWKGLVGCCHCLTGRGFGHLIHERMDEETWSPKYKGDWSTKEEHELYHAVCVNGCSKACKEASLCE